jgi:hypothetical protein
MSKTYTTLTWRERLDIYAARRAEFEARRKAWELQKADGEYLDGMIVRQTRPRVMVVVKNWR